MKELGKGEEREAPTHLIKNSELTHAAHKNRQNHKISSQENGNLCRS